MLKIDIIINLKGHCHLFYHLYSKAGAEKWKKKYWTETVIEFNLPMFFLELLEMDEHVLVW